jgi:hypothetical protein
MYNNKQIIRIGHLTGHGFHETDINDQHISDILDDAEMKLSILQYETEARIRQLDTAMTAFQQHRAELVNYHTYIANTNPGRSGDDSRQWLAVNVR